MKAFLTRLLVVIPVFLATLSHAALTDDQQRRIFHELEQLPDQPSMRQIFDAFGGEWPTLREFYYNSVGIPYSQLDDQALAQMAKGIAIVERAFPNSVVATLGRDAQAFGNWYEAFWVSHGQFDRRIHLAASGASFVRTNFDLNFRFLSDSGIDLFGTERPYLIYDRTSYGDRSQTRSLLRALVWAWIQKGLNPSLLAPRLAALTYDNYYSYHEPWYADGYMGEIRTHFTEQAKVLAVQGTEIPTPSSPLVLQTEGATIPISDGLLWHNGYLTLAEQGDGKVRGAPRAHTGHAENILREQLARARQVSTPEFLNRVRQEAFSLGYDFSVQPQTSNRFKVVVEEPKPPTWKELQAKLDGIRSGLPKGAPDQKGSQLTPNALAIEQWFVDTLRIHEDRSAVILELIRVALEEKAMDRISARDSRFLIAAALREANLGDDLFVRKLTVMLRNSQSLRNKFTEARKHYFEQRGSVDKFEWILENIIRPNGWHCEDDLKKKISEEAS